ncbi:hypothetical protein [Streptomyces pluripotens]|uniref:hypothetical protein n=1 Tax=Streptomyces pluripotens TaxID=1355015 RepID=UPI000575407F|nr:hypothetical protein [Streptomyces pluripotens]
MKEQSKTSASAALGQKKRFIIIGAGAAIAIALLVAGLFYWVTHNYAQEASSPLEKILVQSGAVKVCGSGDPGRGPDNYAPHYASLYELDASKDDAVELITKAAAENGYSLVRNSSPYPYVEQYWDTVGKKSNYPGFSSGNVTVRFSVYGAGTEKLYCDQQPLQSDETHTAISLEVRLPDSK